MITPALAPARPEVLVVDDEPSVVEVLSDVLSAYGYRVTSAASGEEALEAVGRIVPDLIITDVNMPGMTGVELCAHLKAVSRLGRDLKSSGKMPPTVMSPRTSDLRFPGQWRFCGVYRSLPARSTV